jgi:hypothetical protein
LETREDTHFAEVRIKTLVKIMEMIQENSPDDVCIEIKENNRLKICSKKIWTDSANNTEELKETTYTYFSM